MMLPDTAIPMRVPRQHFVAAPTPEQLSAIELFATGPPGVRPRGVVSRQNTAYSVIPGKSRFALTRPVEACHGCMTKQYRLHDGQINDDMWCGHQSSKSGFEINSRIFAGTRNNGTSAEIAGMQIGQPSFMHGQWMSTAVADSGKFQEHDPIGSLTFGDSAYPELPWRGLRTHRSGTDGNSATFRPKSWGATATTNIGNHPLAGSLPGAGLVVRSPGFGPDARPGANPQILREKAAPPYLTCTIGVLSAGTEKWASGHLFANRTREHDPLTQRISSRASHSLPPLESRAGRYGSSGLVRG